MHSLFELPDDAFVRLPSIIGTRDKPGPMPVSRSDFWVRVADGRFPKPYRLSTRVSAWKVGEVRAVFDGYKKEG